MNPERLHHIHKRPERLGPVVYWMQRDQRVRDNWALLHARHLAAERDTPLLVVFCLVPQFLDATLRQYGFMIDGLRQVEHALRSKNISFHLLTGPPMKEIPHFLAKSGAGFLVTDFNPIRTITSWKKDISTRIDIPFIEVDAHNIVPCRSMSKKQEFGAHTLRPKLHRILSEHLIPFPRVKPQKSGTISMESVDWESIWPLLKINRNIGPVGWLRPGENEARRVMRKFIDTTLSRYHTDRNDPTLDAQSNLSPYLHFGQISAQRVAMEVLKAQADPAARDAFLEELIVRRELADNFCHYNRQYDSFDAFHPWAQTTLNAHRRDRRTHIYSMQQFESASTHDRLWNAAQRQMVTTGKMHGYMRMYWAKKILEWTRSPEDALQIAIWLNDTYQLDGRDPNGYAGIAWSIGGVHDRAWPERPVFGKIRYMNETGCRRKFDVDSYIRRFTAP